MNVHKLDTSLLSANLNEPCQAIVYINDLTRINYIADKIKILHYFHMISAVGVEGSLENIQKLSVLPYISYISSNAKVNAIASVTSKRKELDSQISQTMYMNDNITSSYSPYNVLKNIRPCVCVMDTGIAPHVDLCVGRNHIRAFYDLEKGSIDPLDDNGHGTFVSGVICGSGLASGGKVSGKAVGIDLVGLKIMDDKGECSAFKVLQGMQWVIDNKDRYHIKVVCMSFGSKPLERNDPLVLGAEVLVRSGVSVVCAVGNGGVKEGVLSPAISPMVVSVGAVDDSYDIAEFSAISPELPYIKPEVYCRGVAIDGLDRNGMYCVMSGTSVSAPRACGELISIYSRYPNISPQKAKELLVMNAKNIGKLKIIE